MNFIYFTLLNSFTTLIEDTQTGMKTLNKYSLVHVKRGGNSTDMHALARVAKDL